MDWEKNVGEYMEGTTESHFACNATLAQQLVTIAFMSHLSAADQIHTSMVFGQTVSSTEPGLAVATITNNLDDLARAFAKGTLFLA